MIANELGGGLFRGTTDFADHDDRLRLGVRLEQSQGIDEGRADDRITADAEAGRLPDAQAGQLINGFVGQRPRARDHAHRTRLRDLGGHDTDATLTRRNHARAVRPDETHARTGKRLLGAQHIDRRNALGDACGQRQPGVGRFEDRIRGTRRRHEDDRSVGTGRCDRLARRIEDGNAFDGLPAFAGMHATNDLRAVLDRELRVKLAHAAHALNQQLRVLVAENGHVSLLALAAATAFSPASRSVSAGVMSRPESARILRPSSALVPCKRTTSGTSMPSSPAAATTPSAIRSQRTMPPKMFTRIAFTLSSRRMSLKASFTFSLSAPPPASRKFAGEPPQYWIMSRVAIASPAPFTMQPMSPSRPT